MEAFVPELFGVIFGLVLIYIVGKPYLKYRSDKKKGVVIQSEF